MESKILIDSIVLHAKLKIYIQIIVDLLLIAFDQQDFHQAYLADIYG